MFNSSKSESHANSTGKAIEQPEVKKKRDEYVIEIRKQKREETINKKRHTNLEMEKKIENSHFAKSKVYTNESEEKQLEDLIDLWRKKTFSIKDLPDIVHAINSNDIFQQNYGVIALRKILSTTEKPPIQQIIDANLVPKLIKFTERDDEPNLQLEAVWALTNIASGSSHETQVIIDKNGLPALIRLLKSNIPVIAEQAVWGLGNISGDSAACRDAILNSGGLEPLADLVENSDDEKIIKHGTWALSNLTRGKPAPEFSKVYRAIPVLEKVLMELKDEDALVDAAWALSHLSDGAKERIDIVLQTDIGPALKRLLESDYLPLLIPILRFTGNILAGSEEHASKLLKVEGLADNIFKLLEHHHRTVRREACWCISNIAAGNPNQIDIILQYPEIVEKIISITYTDSSEIVKESLWIFSNATNKATTLQIMKLCELKVLECFCRFLEAEDPKLIEIALDGLTHIFACGDRMAKDTRSENIYLIEFERHNALQIVEKLQQHPNYSVYTKALFILETFYDIEEPI